ncbi:hypothetical protein, partial [Alteromonas stellipolaris]
VYRLPASVVVASGNDSGIIQHTDKSCSIFGVRIVLRIEWTMAKAPSSTESVCLLTECLNT